MKINPEQMHQELCDYIHQNLYLPKNMDYGDSFHKLYEELGIISAVTQIAHKFNRLKTQAKKYNHDTTKETYLTNTQEKIEDTLLDLANYCILTVMEIRREQLETSFANESKENQNGIEGKKEK